MNKLILRLATSAATTALVLGSFAGPAFAVTPADGITVDVSGNGSGSINGVDVTQSSTVVVSQSNAVDADIYAKTKANTGGNQASGNTGSGGVTITTGDADATTSIAVTGGSNTATVPCKCICNKGPVDVTVSGNGNDSINGTSVDSSSTFVANQGNSLKAKIKAKTKAKTGNNIANNNTGGGTVGIGTGAATSVTGVGITGPTNTLNSCGCSVL